MAHTLGLIQLNGESLFSKEPHREYGGCPSIELVGLVQIRKRFKISLEAKVLVRKCNICRGALMKR